MTFPSFDLEANLFKTGSHTILISVYLKAISRKLYSIKGGGLKNLIGFFTGEGMPRFKKNSGVLKTAESGNSKTVNYIVIERFLTVIFGITFETTFFCENRHKTVQNRSINI